MTNSTGAQTLFLIDGTAYIHRAYHAIRDLTNSKGLPTNAVFGFTRMLLKLMEERQPDHAVMLFDAKGPTFRHALYRAYKANRPAMPDDMALQIPLIKEVTSGFNIPIIEVPGYEADDLIGTLARLAEAQGYQVVMVTGDKDFMQLVTEQTVIWDPMKEVTIDVAGVKKSHGVAPCQVADVMGLSGDSADNVPGVPGIGPKTAQSLIQAFGSMEAVYAQIDTITRKRQKENLIEFKNQAFLSRALVTIKTDVPLEIRFDDFRLKSPNRRRLADMFKKLEFRQLQKQFQPAAEKPAKRYEAIHTREDLEALARCLKAAEIVAVDTETTSEDPMQARLVGISFAVAAHEAFYIPVGHAYPGTPRQLPANQVLACLRALLEDGQKPKVGQNLKYDAIVLARHGVCLKGIAFDTMVASYLINPSKRAHNLDQIALDFLNHKNITFAEVAGKGKAASFAEVPLEKAVPYACEDADVALLAYHELKQRLEQIGLLELLETVEMPLIEVLIKMEMNGIAVDQDRLRELSKNFDQQLSLLEERIYAVAGEQFNIRSSQQLGAILFEKLKLPVQKKTRKKTGYSTDVDVLTTLAMEHELPALILRHRTLSKLKSTYADALLELIHPQTGRIHTSFNQTVAATGRLSSSEPNLQNIPIRTDEGRQIRSAFVPRRGWTLLSADYSQIELRILAHCSEDPILIKAFQADEDIHTRTASEVFQVLPNFITAELRRQAKVINFGIIYGMSPFSLARELGISQKMAKTYIDHYFERYQGVKAFIDRTIQEARQSKRTTTLLGRIRRLADINSANHNVRRFAERIAVNTPIQGTAADLIKLAMIKVNGAMVAQGHLATMLLSVHDELLFEVPPEELGAMRTLVVQKMEGIWQLKVPLKVNLAQGANWTEAH